MQIPILRAVYLLSPAVLLLTLTHAGAGEAEYPLTGTFVKHLVSPGGRIDTPTGSVNLGTQDEPIILTVRGPASTPPAKWLDHHFRFPPDDPIQLTVGPATSIVGRTEGTDVEFERHGSISGNRVTAFVRSWVQFAGKTVRVDSYYRFTHPNPDDRVAGSLTYPPCEFAMAAGSTWDFRVQIGQDLESHTNGNVFLRVINVASGDELGRSALAAVTSEGGPVEAFWSPSPKMWGLSPIGRHLEATGIDMPDATTVVAVEVVLESGGAELAVDAVADFNVHPVASPLELQNISVTRDPPAGQSFRTGTTPTFTLQGTIFRVQVPAVEFGVLLIGLTDEGEEIELGRSLRSDVYELCQENRQFTLRVTSDEIPDNVHDIELRPVAWEASVLKGAGDTPTRVGPATNYPVRQPCGHWQVIKVDGEAELLRLGQEEFPIVLHGGETLIPSDRIYTGLESKVQIRGGDRSTVVIEELSDVKIASFCSDGDSVRTRLWLKAGEVTSDINFGTSVRSDFSIKSPTATCSVRGTMLTVKHEETPNPRSTVTTSDGAALTHCTDPSVFAGSVEDQTVIITQDSTTGDYSATGDFSPLPTPTVLGHAVNRFASLDVPRGVVVDGSDQPVSIETHVGEVVRISADRTPTIVAELIGEFNGWGGIALDADGNYLVTHALDREVLRIDPVSGAATQIVDGINKPTAITVSGSGEIFVSSLRDGVIHKLDGVGGHSFHAGGMQQPYALAAAPDGTLYAADVQRKAIWKIPPEGGAAVMFADLWTRGQPLGLAVAPDGNLIVGMAGNDGAAELIRIDPAGAISGFGGGFSKPVGFAFTGSGDLFIADSRDNMIYQATPLPGGTARLVLSESEIDFGVVNAGTTRDIEVTMSNTGVGALNVTGLTIGSVAMPREEFSLVTPAVPFSVPPGGEQTLVIRYAPTEDRTHVLWMNFHSNDVDNPSVALRIDAEGTIPEISSVFPLGKMPGESITILGTGFSTEVETIVRFGPFAAEIFDVTSTRLSGVIIPEGAFGVTPITIEVAGYTGLALDYTVAATGGAPQLELAPLVLDFGNVTLGEGTDLTFNVSNSGDAALVVSDIRTDNDVFHITDPELPFVVPPDSGAVAVTVRFEPDSASPPEEGLATIVSNHPLGDRSISLDGRGLFPPLHTPESFAPTHGEAGTLVTVFGTNFGTIARFAEVKFFVPGDPVPLVVPVVELRDTEADFLIPEGLAPGASYGFNLVIHGRSVGLPASAGSLFIPGTGPTPPVITSTLIAQGEVGVPFNYVIAASEFPTEYGATGLPGGLGIDAPSGVISGTPTEPGVFAVELSATNMAGTGTGTLQLTVAPESVPPVITSALTLAGVTGELFSYAIEATKTPTSFDAAPLPPGLSIDAATGEIYGTPIIAGVTDLTITATNASGSDMKTLRITVTEGGGGEPTGVPRKFVHHQLTHFGPGEAAPEVIAMSADGQRIVFSGTDEDIYTMHADGTGLQQIWDGPSGSRSWVDISADGSRVIWTNGRDELHSASFDGTGHQHYDLVFGHPSGPQFQQGASIRVTPKITADGTQIYFANSLIGAAFGGVYRINFDGTGLAQMFSYEDMAQALFGTDGSDYNGNAVFQNDFDLSDDGARLIASTDQGDGAIFTWDGSTFRVVAEENAQSDGALAISGDGQHIAYVRDVETGTTEDMASAEPFDGSAAPTSLFTVTGSRGAKITMPQDGSVVVSASELAPEGLFASDGSWSIDFNPYDAFFATEKAALSSDGRRMAYISTNLPPGVSRSRRQIWVVDIDPAATGEATGFGSVVMDPPWVLHDPRTTSILTAELLPGSDPLENVRFSVLKDGTFTTRALVNDERELSDDGSTRGDAIAADGVFTMDEIGRDLIGTETGAYVIRVYAQAGDYIAACDFSPFHIVASEAEAWRREHFGDDADVPAIAGPGANPDRDSLVNLLERVVGSDPNDSTDVNLPLVGAVMPDSLQVGFPFDTLAANDVDLFIEGSEDLVGPWEPIMRRAPGGSWTSLVPGARVEETGNNRVIVITVTVPRGIEQFPAYFVRLRAISQ